ncbi:response regulator [Parapedobacter sp. 10938]|uniref:response regulator n=1 Tax=Parapedobacter flavus TaxID=3110225 RepID=UPI002DB86142|nr:response regulator [Parapedobacter sp. 10938]MEC3881436.1 response regulator [Parapedobacter sp. 10938]
MKRLTFSGHIYLGFSLLIAILIVSLFYLILLFKQIDIGHSTLTSIKTTYIVTAILVFALIIWLLVYITKSFEHNKKIAYRIRQSNRDLSRLSKEKEIDNWILSGLAALDNQTRGGRSEKEIATNAIRTTCQHVQAKVGTIYLKSASHEDVYIHAGSYAVETEDMPSKIMGGQGMAGESITCQKQLVLSDIPENYLTVTSSLGRTTPKNIVVQPLIYEEEVLGVMEIGFFREIDQETLQFLQRAGISLAVASKVAQTHAALVHLYEETQQQAEELEAQQEELRVQQEELKNANLELEEKARLLEERNISLDLARQSIALKVGELEQSGKYKSEFMANMSHELRTPLNSILILAKLLEENKTGNLLAEQVKYASVIHHAGSDLLDLIDNILDLSKIESGNIELLLENITLSSIAEDMLDLFGSVADSRGLDFRITVNEGLPVGIMTDEQRLRQILKNLLSNAFKFTKEKGRVELQFMRASESPDWRPGLLKDVTSDQAIAIAVTDTGVGIAPEKQQLIFEAFKQADGSTSRQFGGTGLGLSICLELATLLKGSIHVTSAIAKGSAFTLFLPLHNNPETAACIPEANTASLSVPSEDRKEQHTPAPEKVLDAGGPKRLLIVEDDRNFADILESYAQEQGFDTLVARRGDAGLQMALDAIPHAIILDIMLPVMDGWTVLKKLKSNPTTQDIPVHLMSAHRPEKHPIGTEAVGFLVKPASKKSLDEVFTHLHKTIASPLKKVLVVEDHEIQSDNLKSFLEDGGVDVKQAFTGAEALAYLKEGERYDGIVLDIDLPDISGIDLLDEIKQTQPYADIPVIINTAMELTTEMARRILQHAKTMVLKSEKSNSRILDEVKLFINRLNRDKLSPIRVYSTGPESKTIHMHDILTGKHILLVDDDMRNIFALSTVFAPYELTIDTANNGREALDILKDSPGIDLVLMDIMMPEMDGYEAIMKIRANKQFAALPVIAVTAKAMQGDRQRVLDVGASDYIAKPVDVNKLLSLLRVWLS